MTTMTTSEPAKDELLLYQLRNTETGQVAHTRLLLASLAEQTNARANRELPRWHWRWALAESDPVALAEVEA